MVQEQDYAAFPLSIAMTEEWDRQVSQHLDKGPTQEDLTFALWQPSLGHTRFTAILQELVLPEQGDRILQGNVAFTPEYVQRVLQCARHTQGIALLHSHLSPDWQDMSADDCIAEQMRLAAAVSGATNLPLVGLTRGTDGAWSGRFWLRHSPRIFVRRWAPTVRVVGQQLRITYQPELLPPPTASAAQVATVSVWGEEKQADLARVHVGIVGLGSVGSLVAEALSRTGIGHITLLDHDHIETRNVDRTLGAVAADALRQTPKVAVAERMIQATHTALPFLATAHQKSVLTPEGLKLALDCDVLFSCVDRPWPRHLLNAVAYAHLIPVIDGGIIAKVEQGEFLHADWRIHTVGPGRPCMQCLGALRREEVALDRDGKLDDPAYLQGLGPSFHPVLARQNVFPFSMSVAAHEVLQFIGLVTGQERIGGSGAQMYHCYPGCMTVDERQGCESACEYAALTASAQDLNGNCASSGVSPDLEQGS